ncbi:Structure-specific endonuclease subunit slx1 like [Actinidia chinensis var. chinensis]|uniref:Structure-specific endonuclease subunit slx1 like n=1 Tax=Actinidia chinensis var. chinensis TaxID=1590841 RepID=A0A2R6QKM3_ACTCC|nr:Structure-specific endonuclease subunit slx1 like [Actinidia chinensis var. chinensis]
MATLLSKAFRSLKPHHCPNPNQNPESSKSSSSLQSSRSPSSSSSKQSKSKNSWSVYLILSTNTPIKTYVGVTTNFSRRLKQHNGELKGGAKASRAGRPWVCACIIQGFTDRSAACEFESKWKNFSRKQPRKRKCDETRKLLETRSLLLLQHRQAALNRVKSSIDFSHLEIDWHLNPR